MAEKKKEVPGFLEWLRKQEVPMIPDEFGFSWRVEITGENTARFYAGLREGGKDNVIDTYDFTPYFPVDNGEPEDSKYFRRRTQLDRNEAGYFFRYRRHFGDKAKEFEPFPPPSKRQIEKSEETDWPF